MWIGLQNSRQVQLSDSQILKQLSEIWKILSDFQTLMSDVRQPMPRMGDFASEIWMTFVRISDIYRSYEWNEIIVSWWGSCKYISLVLKITDLAFINKLCCFIEIHLPKVLSTFNMHSLKSRLAPGIQTLHITAIV